MHFAWQALGFCAFRPWGIREKKIPYTTLELSFWWAVPRCPMPPLTLCVWQARYCRKSFSRTDMPYMIMHLLFPGFKLGELLFVNDLCLGSSRVTRRPGEMKMMPLLRPRGWSTLFFWKSLQKYFVFEFCSKRFPKNAFLIFKFCC